eukprot:8636571-Heterocapsa_arctica.AAC.1
MAIQQVTINFWKKATLGRRDLDGLEVTVDWTMPRKLMKQLEKNAPGNAGALRNILAGGNVAADQNSR